MAGNPNSTTYYKKARNESKQKKLSMEEAMPSVYKKLKEILFKLERHYKDMQDVEFTVENKILWILQTRSGKRTAKSQQLRLQ